MKKQELLKMLDKDLLEKLFAFCYARAKDSYEAQELCSDIIYALVRTANTDGEITDVYSYIWKIARNVYADFCNHHSKHAYLFYEGDPEQILPLISNDGQTQEQDDIALLKNVYQQIAFLTKAYREVMVAFYLDGLPIKDIAKTQNTSETAIRQRLFSARKVLKTEVEKMENQTAKKPVTLDDIDFTIWGTGSPAWGDPREVCTRRFSRHIVWLCHQKPMTAKQISEELNIPTIYVEEEVEILTRGSNEEYGLLRRLDNGKFAINFILLDKATIDKAHNIYVARLPEISDVIEKFIQENKERFLAFPYLNHRIDWNLILWQQIHTISGTFARTVYHILKEKHFTGIAKTERPFSVFGFESNGTSYGGGWDGINATNICGYAQVRLDNIYTNRVKKHFHCGHNIANDPEIQLAIQAINGIDIKNLSEQDKEHAAKAIECGYLYREGDILYTKILVSNISDSKHLYEISCELEKDYLNASADSVAADIAKLIYENVPEHLLGEWQFVNDLANMPVLDSLVDLFIDKGILIQPKDGIGAEGCWMSVGL